MTTSVLVGDACATGCPHDIASQCREGRRLGCPCSLLMIMSRSLWHAASAACCSCTCLHHTLHQLSTPPHLPHPRCSYILPEFDDEFVKKHYPAFESAADMRERLIGMTSMERSKHLDKEIQDQVVERITECVDMKVPDRIIEVGDHPGLD